MSVVTLQFFMGPRDGEQIVMDFDELPEQDAYPGYWIEDCIVNDCVYAMPLNRATPNDQPAFFVE